MKSRFTKKIRQFNSLSKNFSNFDKKEDSSTFRKKNKCAFFSNLIKNNTCLKSHVYIHLIKMLKKSLIKFLINFTSKIALNES